MQEQAAHAGPLPALLIATQLCMQPLHETARHAAALYQFICSPTSFRGIGADSLWDAHPQQSCVDLVLWSSGCAPTGRSAGTTLVS